MALQLASCQPPNKQLQRTVTRRRVRAASAPFHYALAARWIAQRAAAELRRSATGSNSSEKTGLHVPAAIRFNVVVALLMSAGCTGLSRSVSVELEECTRAYGQDNLVDLSSSESGELLEDLREGYSSFTYNTKDYRYWLFQVGDNEGLLCENRVGGVGRAL